ncbi:hypothetical protein, partial [Mesorhizobium sp. M2E.F.Ca.ET.166.01.1.1]|uniref:hypothetical protein n=1 Tax=Mesorhizobium sp. M2E.F.Ca.ET.166.01.1.1 TaxID=2500523 RepID=UPI0032B24C9F
LHCAKPDGRLVVIEKSAVARREEDVFDLHFVLLDSFIALAGGRTSTRCPPSMRHLALSSPI